MEQVQLGGVPGVRWLPDEPTGVGALVLAGSSGRIDSARAELLAGHGVLAESLQWFGGPGQHVGPWEIPLETFAERVAAIARECDRVVVLGTSFGAEAALLTGAHSSDVAAVAAFAPSDVVWAGVREDGTSTSHWTLDGRPLPWVPLDETWQADTDPPAFVGLYEASRRRFADQAGAAAIPVERIGRLLLVAGTDDQVWPAAVMAESIRDRRSAHGLPTELVMGHEAGHRAILPGEPVVVGGVKMRRGGSEEADRRLGAAVWPPLLRLLRGD